MEKRWMVVFANLFVILLIVYTDFVIWSSFGPLSMFQQFPIIYLVVIPIMLIAVTMLWGKLPSAD